MFFLIYELVLILMRILYFSNYENHYFLNMPIEIVIVILIVIIVMIIMIIIVFIEVWNIKNIDNENLVIIYLFYLIKIGINI